MLERQESELQPGLFRDVFRVIPDPPPEECKPQRLECVLSSRPDLWRVLMLHPGAMAEIPELEFEIGADHRRRVDSIYNHIGGAIFNLERHVEMLGDDNEQAARERQGIKDMCDELRKVLDMEGGPYTLVVTDPGGLSAFKPPEGVKVTALEQTTQYDRAARALAVAEREEEDDEDDSDDETAKLPGGCARGHEDGRRGGRDPGEGRRRDEEGDKDGEGTERPGKGAEVAVHYVGTLEDGTKVRQQRGQGRAHPVHARGRAGDKGLGPGRREHAEGGEGDADDQAGVWVRGRGRGWGHPGRRHAPLRRRAGRVEVELIRTLFHRGTFPRRFCRLIGAQGLQPGHPGTF